MFGKIDWALKLTRVAFRVGQVAPNATGKLAHRLFLTPRGSRGRSRLGLFASAKPFTVEGCHCP
jgi:hypothetical protein